MAPQIVSIQELARQVQANVISDDDVEYHYGTGTLKLVYDRLQEVYYGVATVN